MRFLRTFGKDMADLNARPVLGLGGEDTPDLFFYFKLIFTQI